MKRFDDDIKACVLSSCEFDPLLICDSGLKHWLGLRRCRDTMSMTRGWLFIRIIAFRPFSLASLL